MPAGAGCKGGKKKQSKKCDAPSDENRVALVTTAQPSSTVVFPVCYPSTSGYTITVTNV